MAAYMTLRTLKDALEASPVHRATCDNLDNSAAVHAQQVPVNGTREDILQVTEYSADSRDWFTPDREYLTTPQALEEQYPGARWLAVEI